MKLFLILGTLLAGLAVALGAFGAHGLKKLVDAETVSVYQTGVQYQMYHALALIAVGILIQRAENSLMNYAGIFFIGGIVCFSGSLYLLSSFKAMNKVVPSFIYPITPLGGILFIVGWILLLFALLKK
jgi:uncharacterized membrane protein YgdD (TMEM256/DUF423 family)